ncbi:hypothetical protein [Pelagibius sp. Alg239-R121]|uniref:hypothetical protein n=1 Tax=Pelagibius sp. Alg239-R121 TaxID=2993448 RepID=UPI0024A67238|nr:hypothetical protein [Pelagibius sp. Alg239-R121]
MPTEPRPPFNTDVTQSMDRSARWNACKHLRDLATRLQTSANNAIRRAAQLECEEAKEHHKALGGIRKARRCNVPGAEDLLMIESRLSGLSLAECQLGDKQSPSHLRIDGARMTDDEFELIRRYRDNYRFESAVREMVKNAHSLGYAGKRNPDFWDLTGKRPPGEEPARPAAPKPRNLAPFTVIDGGAS